MIILNESCSNVKISCFLSVFAVFKSERNPDVCFAFVFQIIDRIQIDQLDQFNQFDRWALFDIFPNICFDHFLQFSDLRTLVDFAQPFPFFPFFFSSSNQSKTRYLDLIENQFLSLMLLFFVLYQPK